MYFLNFGSNSGKLTSVQNKTPGNLKSPKPIKILSDSSTECPKPNHTQEKIKSKNQNNSRQSNPDWSTTVCTSDDILFMSSCLQVPEVVIPDTVCLSHRLQFEFLASFKILPKSMSLLFPSD